MKLNFLDNLRRPHRSPWQSMWRDIFKLSLVSFAGLFLVEYVAPGFAANWFQPAWLLLLTLVSVTVYLISIYRKP